MQKQYVRSLFDGIAPRYDFLNHLLSVGIDVAWRRRTVRALAPLKPRSILDVATGTGDVALALMRLRPDRIVGIDIADAMLERARMKVSRRGLAGTIELVSGEAEQLPFEAGTFDAATVAFGVRNFEDLEKGLREMYRVLRPDGRIAVLEFSRPSTFPVRQIYELYFRRLLPLVGRWVSRHPEAYQYLPDTVMRFPEGEAFLRILRGAGFAAVKQHRLTFGIASLYVGDKPPDPGTA